MKILVVDDIRNHVLDAVYARTPEEGLQKIISEPWDEVWLDYDMGGVKTNLMIVKKLEELAQVNSILLPIGRFVLHTSNPVGREIMRSYLESYYKVVYAIVVGR